MVPGIPMEHVPDTCLPLCARLSFPRINVCMKGGSASLIPRLEQDVGVKLHRGSSRLRSSTPALPEATLTDNGTRNDERHSDLPMEISAVFKSCSFSTSEMQAQFPSEEMSEIPSI